MPSDTRKNLRFRGALAVTALVFVLYGSAFSIALIQRFRLGNLAEMLPNHPLLAISLMGMIDLGGLVFLLMFIWVIWLLLMKPLFTKSELSTMFSFEFGHQSRVKRILKRVFNLVY